MSTKNLARTVIEGGRYYFNSWERRHSHGEARAAERVVADRARTAAADDDLVWPEPKHVHKSFRDKVSPAEQWLLSHVGRPWDRVRSEIAARFDTRTLAGQHIVFDHLLPRRWDIDGSWRVAGARFFVDRHGILRVDTRPRRWARRTDPGPSACYVRRAEELARGRRVVVRGAHAYWLEVVEPWPALTAPRYRQGRALDAAERRAFDALPAQARALVERHLP